MDPTHTQGHTELCSVCFPSLTPLSSKEQTLRTPAIWKVLHVNFTLKQNYDSKKNSQTKKTPTQFQSAYFPKHRRHTEQIFYQLPVYSCFTKSGCNPDLEFSSTLLVLPVQHHAGIWKFDLGPSVVRGNYCLGPTKRTKAIHSSRNYPWFEKQVCNVLSPHPECKNYLSHLTQCHAAPVCVLVHHKRCSSLQYQPHKKRFMSSKNLINGKAIIQSLLFLQSCTSKQLSPWGFKNC